MTDLDASKLGKDKKEQIVVDSKISESFINTSETVEEQETDNKNFATLLIIMIGSLVYFIRKIKLKNKEIVNLEDNFNKNFEEKNLENNEINKELIRTRNEAKTIKEDYLTLKGKVEKDKIQQSTKDSGAQAEIKILEMQILELKSSLEEINLSYEEKTPVKISSSDTLRQIINAIETIKILKEGKVGDHLEDLEFMENQLENLLFNNEIIKQSPALGETLAGNKKLSIMCEIVGTVKNLNLTPGTIAEVLSPGYLTKEGKVLKKAEVKVYN